MFHGVHTSIIYKSQKLERTQIFLNRAMDTGYVYIYTMECYSAIKSNDFIKLLVKWLELGNVTLSEVTEPQKNTYTVYTH